MTTYEDVTLSCPNCRSEVAARVLMSTNFMGSTTDLHRMTGGFDPLVFMVHSCEVCGFTGDVSDFQGTVETSVATQIEEQVRPHVRDEHLGPDARWEFAARIAEWRAEPKPTVAQLYLNAAWCADDPEREHFYRRKAADWFERALEADGVENRPLLLYLVGELHRRVGEKAVADEWFDRAVDEAPDDEEGTWVKEIAVQQKTDPREVL